MACSGPDSQDQMKFRETFRCARGRVNVRSAKEGAPVLDQPFWILVDKVLIAECDYTALSDPEGQLLSTAVVELMKLNALDIGTKLRSQVLDRSPSEEGLRFRIGESLVAGIGVLKGLERGELEVGIECRQVPSVGVLGSRSASLAKPFRLCRAVTILFLLPVWLGGSEGEGGESWSDGLGDCGHLCLFPCFATKEGK